MYYGNAATSAVNKRYFPNLSEAGPPFPVVVNVSSLGLGLTADRLNILGSGNLANDGGVFMIPVGGPSVVWSWPGPAGSAVGTVGSIAVGQNDYLYFGSRGALGTRLVKIQANTASPTFGPTAGNVEAAPVIGRDGTVYVATESGSLQAFDSQLRQLWGMPPPTTGTLDFDVGPTIDCARDALGAPSAGPGTLYAIGKANGTLYSVIVDSRGIDRSAPWPKFQRNTRNTGSVDDPQSDVVCP